MDTCTARWGCCPSLLPVFEMRSSQGAASLYAVTLSRFNATQDDEHTGSDIRIDGPSILLPLYAYATRVLPIGRVHFVYFMKRA